MSRYSALGWLQAQAHQSRRSPGKRRSEIGPRSARSAPGLEALESRLVLSTLTVTSADDDGSSGTLRALIGAASPGSTIVFDHRLDGRTIALKQGALEVTKSLDIEGPGAGQLTISGNAAGRVFDISSGATVTLARLTIADGKASVGGGIDNAGTLLLDHSTVSNNQAVGGLGGGGILNEAGAILTLEHSALIDNTATAGSDAVDVFGGGLLNEGSAIVTASTFTGNRALGGGGSSFFGGSVGGGLDNFGGATVTVTASTFGDNQALGAGAGDFGIGGAIENNAGLDLTHPSIATVSDSVFVGNVAGGAQASPATAAPSTARAPERP